MQVWVFEDEDEAAPEREPGANLYVHHDVMLAAFPLALAWLDCVPSTAGQDRGNIAAVGTMEPGIELWPLDVADAVEPLATLGGPALDAAAPRGKKKAKRKVCSCPCPHAVCRHHVRASQSLDLQAARRSEKGV